MEARHATAGPRVWMTKSTDPGLQACRDAGVIAVNFYVRFDVSGRAESELVADLKGSRSAIFARQLFRFANAIQVGDRVVTKDAGDWYEGTVTGDYFYQPSLIDEHPHVRSVSWQHTPLDQAEAQDVQALRRSPYATVELLEPRTDGGERAVSQPPVARQRGTLAIAKSPSAPLQWRADRAGVHPVWPEVDDGPRVPCARLRRPCRPAEHSRWRHTATLVDAPTAPGPAMLVVGLNPSCPDDLGQATFAPVIAVAEQLGARWAGMVNLLPLRLTDLSTLSAEVPAETLVADNRRVVEAMLGQVQGVIAAWGMQPGSTAPSTANAVIGDERDWLLKAAARAGVDVVGIDGRPLHPSRWLQTLRGRASDRSDEAAQLAALLGLLPNA